MTRSCDSDLTVESVDTLLRTKTIGRPLYMLDEVDSTNREALAFIQTGAHSGTVIVAESQTSGRGRRGRAWHSPAAGNLYCSIIVSLPLLQRETVPTLPWIPLLAGVAAVTAIRDRTELRPSLKWPNDLVLNHKKCGGILCETMQRNDRPFVVIGIGLNVNSNPERFPDEFKTSGTSLRAESGLLIDRSALLAQFLGRLEHQLDSLVTASPDQWRRTYLAHCSTVGRRVSVQCEAGELLEGSADSIGEDGCLKIVPDSASTTEGPARTVEIRAGKVVHLRIAT